MLATTPHFLFGLPPWVIMWSMLVAVFSWWKILAMAVAPPGGGWRRPVFMFAWGGMDARAFLQDSAAPPRPVEWVSAIAKTLLGFVLYFWAGRQFSHPLAIGWVGMIGFVFIFHFGGFHVLSCIWRAAGVSAQPIMHNPAGATSLGDFWGRRWNLAFSELAERYVFRPTVRKLGIAGATFAVFFISGLIHEAVISLPAMDGWGLPTAYFCLQGAAAMAERSRVGRRLGLRRGWRGWLFTMVITAGPAFFLFHPPFVHHVILPMMKATGAL
jgi:hypothetical protein